MDKGGNVHFPDKRGHHVLRSRRKGQDPYCSMQTVLDEGDILNVAVRSDRQKEGIGYFLVDSMLMLAQAQGISLVHLEVRESNGTARRLYQRLGFVEDGLRKNYYTDPLEKKQ